MRAKLLLIMAISLVACNPTPSALPPSSAAPAVGPVVPVGQPEIRDLGPSTETVWNCGSGGGPVVKHPSMSVATNWAVEWEVGGTAGTGVRIGDGIIPGGVDLSVSLEGRYANKFDQSIQQGIGWDLPAEPNTVVVYTLMWREVWQPGYVDVRLADQRVVRVNVRYRTGIQSEIVGKQQQSCGAGQQTSQPIATPRTTSAACSFIDELVQKGDVLQRLESPKGTFAGVQIRLFYSVDVPAGWIVHKEGKEYVCPCHLESGIVASFWSPESCRPLAPFISAPPLQSSNYCFGKCWQYDDNARTMTWTGPTNGIEDIWQPSGEALQKIRDGYTAIFATSVPGEILACVLVVNGQTIKNACDGVLYQVPSGIYRVMSANKSVGGFRWCPLIGYGWRTNGGDCK